MSKLTKIYPSKQPRRPHFIPEWAERRNMSQAEMWKELGADKGLVSRWFNGSSPGVDWQAKLVELFSLDSAEDLFNPPENHWMKRLFKSDPELLQMLENRTTDELQRIKQMIAAAFPEKKDGTNRK